MIEIIKVNWLSVEAKEAEVTISDGNFEIVCFAHPFSDDIGSVIRQPLHTVNSEKIYKNDDKTLFSVERIGKTFGYCLIGKIIDQVNNQVKIGEFIIQLDTILPRDLSLNDYISITCERVDVY